MANPSVVSFLFLLIVGAVHSDIIIQEYKLKHIVQISSTNIGKTNKYSCKKICMDDPSCKALSTKVLENGKVKCDYSTEKPSEEELKNSPNSTTYVKNVCEPPFKLVKNVGCIMLSEDIKNFSDATTSCPEGSRLHSPATLGLFEHLRQHLVHLKEESNDLAVDNIYIGMKMNEITKKWELFHGGDIGEGVVGEYPFAGDNPNKGFLCASMHYNKVNFFYHLADRKCTKEYKYLCQVLV